MSLTKRISIFFPFRSFHNHSFNLKVGLFLVLPIVFNLIILFNLHGITEMWSLVIKYFFSQLNFDMVLVHTKFTLFNKVFFLPSIDLAADLPGAEIWWLWVLITILLLVVSFFIPDSFLPFKYFLRVFIFLIWFTQLFFLYFPMSFPYNIEVYTRNGFLQIIALLFATPWIFGLTYYFYGYGVINKILITLGTLLYLIVLAPCQYTLNAVIIHVYSLMFMPVLYFFTGLLLNILSVIAFYAYGVSLEKMYPKYKN